MTAGLLRERARHLTPERAPGARVCSGMLTEEADGVAAELAAVGLSVAERRDEGDWAGLLLRPS